MARHAPGRIPGKAERAWGERCSAQRPNTLTRTADARQLFAEMEPYSGRFEDRHKPRQPCATWTRVQPQCFDDILNRVQRSRQGAPMSGASAFAHKGGLQWLGPIVKNTVDLNEHIDSGSWVGNGGAPGPPQSPIRTRAGHRTYERRALAGDCVLTNVPKG